MPGIVKRVADRVGQVFQVRNGSASCWRESEDICALADSERHFGHAVRAGSCWIAYDGMHLNPKGDGFRVIGTFASVSAAKQAIEENAGISWAWEAAGSTVEPEAKIGLNKLRTLSAS